MKFTMRADDRFPVGTTVSVYPVLQLPATRLGAPSGVALTSGVVASDSSVVFSGLADGADYFAYANVGGGDVYVTFRVDDASSTVPVYVAPPTGTLATDDANLTAALAALSPNGRLIFSPGTYVLKIKQLIPTFPGGVFTLPSDGQYLVPDGTTIVVPRGTVLQVGPNQATGGNAWVMFGSASALPTGITFEGGGTLDGNRRGGNHGASEVIEPIMINDPVDVQVLGLTFYNWRSEAALFEWNTAGPVCVRFLYNRVLDCGIAEVGDTNSNARQGVAFIGGRDLIVALNHFDTIGAYAVDFEADSASKTFDNIVSGLNTFRNVGVGGAGGEVNVSQPSGVPHNVQILDRLGASVPNVSSLMPTPGNASRRVWRDRTSTDLALNSAAWADVSNADFDITLPAQAGDIIEYTPNMMVLQVGDFLQFDVATIVAGAPVNYFSSGTDTPNGAGVGSWRVQSGASNAAVCGGVFYTVKTADVVTDGTRTTVTLRLRYKQNAGTAQTVHASAGTCAAQVAAVNQGPGW